MPGLTVPNRWIGGPGGGGGIAPTYQPQVLPPVGSGSRAPLDIARVVVPASTTLLTAESSAKAQIYQSAQGALATGAQVTAQAAGSIARGMANMGQAISETGAYLLEVQQTAALGQARVDLKKGLQQEWSRLTSPEFMAEHPNWTEQEIRDHLAGKINELAAKSGKALVGPYAERYAHAATLKGLRLQAKATEFVRKRATDRAQAARMAMDIEDQKLYVETTDPHKRKLIAAGVQREYQHLAAMGMIDETVGQARLARWQQSSDKARAEKDLMAALTGEQVDQFMARLNQDEYSWLAPGTKVDLAAAAAKVKKGLAAKDMAGKRLSAYEFIVGNCGQDDLGCAQRYTNDPKWLKRMGLTLGDGAKVEAAVRQNRSDRLAMIDRQREDTARGITQAVMELVQEGRRAEAWNFIDGQAHLLDPASVTTLRKYAGGEQDLISPILKARLREEIHQGQRFTLDQLLARGVPPGDLDGFVAMQQRAEAAAREGKYDFVDKDIKGWFLSFYSDRDEGKQKWFEFQEKLNARLQAQGLDRYSPEARDQARDLMKDTSAWWQRSVRSFETPETATPDGRVLGYREDNTYLRVDPRYPGLDMDVVRQVRGELRAEMGEEPTINAVRFHAAARQRGIDPELMPEVPRAATRAELLELFSNASVQAAEAALRAHGKKVTPANIHAVLRGWGISEGER